MQKNILLTILLSGLFISSSFAQDRLFTYTYQSGVLQPGQSELEVWSTFKQGRTNFYRALEHRLEFETGLTKRLQTAFYLNYSSNKGLVIAPGDTSIQGSTSYSFSNEWKFKLTDPVANTIGSALYAEWTYGADEIELEAKLILDKKIGKTFHALNIVGELEFENEIEKSATEVKVEQEMEKVLELDYGFMYKKNSNFGIGFEARSHSKYTDKNELKRSGLFAGPAFSYVKDGFWVNLSVLPQITDLKTGNQNLVKYEKVNVRLIFSFML